jgi:MSHA biogenesis protein MshK
MNLRFARPIAISVLLAVRCAAGYAADAAPAGVFADPTRPPTVSAPGAEKGAQNRTVQSVLIAPGRSVAVVDGELVRVGSRLGEAQVVKIDESGVVLRNGAKMETLRLLPDAARVGPRASRHNTNEERAK